MKIYKNFKTSIIYEKCGGLIVWTFEYRVIKKSPCIWRLQYIIRCTQTFLSLCTYSNVKGTRKVVPVKNIKAYRGSRCRAVFLNLCGTAAR